MVITTTKSHLRPQLGTEPAVPRTAQHTARVPTSDSDSPHLAGTHLCTVVLATEPPRRDVGQPHHTGSLQAHPRQGGRCSTPAWDAGIFSLPSRNWVLQAISLGVDTKLITATGMRQRRRQRRNEVEEYAFALWLQSPWWSPEEIRLQRWELVPWLQMENYFGEYHSCTKPSILIFKNMGE